jgi:hypothetical protein
METLRLCSIQNPSHVGRMLDTLVDQCALVSGGCQQVLDLAMLNSHLEALAIRAVDEGRVWACWSDAHETHLFTCEMSLALSRERRTPVLLVNRYNDKAELKDVGSWLADPQGKWLKLT